MQVLSSCRPMRCPAWKRIRSILTIRGQYGVDAAGKKDNEN